MRYTVFHIHDQRQMKSVTGENVKRAKEAHKIKTL